MQKEVHKRKDNRHKVSTKSRHIRVPVTETMGKLIDSTAEKQKVSTAQFMRDAAIAKIGEVK